MAVLAFPNDQKDSYSFRLRVHYKKHKQMKTRTQYIDITFETERQFSH